MFGYTTIIHRKSLPHFMEIKITEHRTKGVGTDQKHTPGVPFKHETKIPTHVCVCMCVCIDL